MKHKELALTTQALKRRRIDSESSSDGELVMAVDSSSDGEWDEYEELVLIRSETIQITMEQASVFKRLYTLLKGLGFFKYDDKTLYTEIRSEEEESMWKEQPFIGLLEFFNSSEEDLTEMDFSDDFKPFIKEFFEVQQKLPPLSKDGVNAVKEIIDFFKICDLEYTPDINSASKQTKSASEQVISQEIDLLMEQEENYLSFLKKIDNILKTKVDGDHKRKIKHLSESLNVFLIKFIKKNKDISNFIESKRAILLQTDPNKFNETYKQIEKELNSLFEPKFLSNSKIELNDKWRFFISSTLKEAFNDIAISKLQALCSQKKEEAQGICKKFTSIEHKKTISDLTSDYVDKRNSRSVEVLALCLNLGGMIKTNFPDFQTIAVKELEINTCAEIFRLYFQRVNEIFKETLVTKLLNTETVKRYTAAIQEHSTGFAYQKNQTPEINLKDLLFKNDMFHKKQLNENNTGAKLNTLLNFSIVTRKSGHEPPSALEGASAEPSSTISIKEEISDNINSLILDLFPEFKDQYTQTIYDKNSIQFTYVIEPKQNKPTIEKTLFTSESVLQDRFLLKETPCSVFRKSDWLAQYLDKFRQYSLEESNKYEKVEVVIDDETDLDLDDASKELLKSACISWLQEHPCKSATDPFYKHWSSPVKEVEQIE